MLGPGQPPIAAQDGEQLRRQHDAAVLPALAVLDPDHHPAAVDIADLEAEGLGRAQPGRVGLSSARRVFRLGTASRNRTTSSARSTTGSLRGSRA